MAHAPALPLNDWERIAGFVSDSQTRRSLRLVSRTCRDATDNTTRRLTVFRTGFLAFPDLRQFFRCTCVHFVDERENSPSCEVDGPFNGALTSEPTIAISGQFWWRRKDLRQWIAQQKGSRDFKVALMLCVSEGCGGRDLADDLEASLKLEDAPSLTYLGVWPQCEAGVMVTEDVRWQRCLPALDTVEVLYLEFVTLDAAVLAGMPRLRELRLLFDAWEVTNTHTLSKLPNLETIYLEPATANTLPVEVLLGLGSHVRTLKLEGRMSTLAMAGNPSWTTLLPLLFGKLESLQAFEAYINAVDLIEAAEAVHAAADGAAREARAGSWLLLPYKQLWIAIDEETRGFRGGYRTIDAAMAVA